MLHSLIPVNSCYCHLINSFKTHFPEVEKYLSRKIENGKNIPKNDKELLDINENLPNDEEKHEDYRKMPYIEPKLRDDEKVKLQTMHKLMSRKGVYPYSYFDRFERFSETELPPKKEFYNKLTDSHITDDDNNHAQHVFKSMGMKNLKDFHDFYLTTDVLLLADVFETFRDMCLRNYRLDPSHFYTAPGLSWEAALKMTNVKLELLTDPDMFLFIEDGIRGGVSTITHRYARANNCYMKNFEIRLRLSNVIYWDANNLYGWAMSMFFHDTTLNWI